MRDHGAGLSGDEREHLFDPFGLPAEGSGGLGLYFIHQAVRAQGP